MNDISDNVFKSKSYQSKGFKGSQATKFTKLVACVLIQFIQDQTDFKLEMSADTFASYFGSIFYLHI